MQHTPLKHQESATRVTSPKNNYPQNFYCFFEKKGGYSNICFLKLVLILFPRLPVFLLATFWLKVC
jgi:hypothetical protein